MGLGSEKDQDSTSRLIFMIEAESKDKDLGLSDPSEQLHKTQ
jgi:hypothetical protein